MKISAWNKESWNGFVCKAPQGTVFCISNFMESYGYNIRYLKCEKGNEIIAGFSFVEAEDGIIKPMPFQVYSGPVFKNMSGLKEYRRNEISYQAMTAFAEYLFKNYSCVDIIFHWSTVDLRPFQWLHYHEKEKGYYDIEIRYTSILSIMNPEDTTGYRQSRRYDLNKSAKIKYSTQVSQDLDTLEQLYEMTFARQRLEVPHKTKILMRKIYKNLMYMGNGIMFISEIENKPASVAFFAYDKLSAYYLWGATDPSFRNSGIGTRNLYEAFQILNKDKGINYVDFVGVNSPQRGSYKLSFGGKLVSYNVVSKSSIY